LTTASIEFYLQFVYRLEKNNGVEVK